MADILIRKVDEGVKALLKRRAARHGRSLEADLRETLERLARDEAGLDFVLAGTEVAVLERQETEVQRQVALQERQARLASDAENVLLREELARLRGK